MSLLSERGNFSKQYPDFQRICRQRADMKGKQYLLDLTLEDDYHVIPTVDGLENLDMLPDCERYVVKPTEG